MKADRFFEGELNRIPPGYPTKEKVLQRSVPQLRPLRVGSRGLSCSCIQRQVTEATVES